MRKVCSFLCAITVSFPMFAEQAPEKKPNPIVHKVDRTETININTNKKTELIKDKKDFCAKSETECEKSCKSWLREQKKTLKKDLRTSHCSGARFLYGKEEAGCMSYLCSGEISYVLK